MTEKEQKEAIERELIIRITVMSRVLMDTVSTVCGVADPLGIKYNKSVYIQLLNDFVQRINQDGNRKEIIVPMQMKA